MLLELAGNNFVASMPYSTDSVCIYIPVVGSNALGNRLTVTNMWSNVFIKIESEY